MNPLTRAESRALDLRAQSELLLPGELLMENAGRAVAEAALALARERRCGRAVVAAGPGNNGGDGFVAARHLLGRLPVEVLVLGDPERIAGDAARNLERCRRLAISIRALDAAAPLAAALAGAPPALAIDALFGTGLARPLDGLARAAVEALNAAAVPVVAVDLPSGLDCDTGEILGAAVRADVTVTFVAEKVGFALAAGPAHCGRVLKAPIGFPAAWR